MTCLEISLNGKIACVAGVRIGSFGCGIHCGRTADAERFSCNVSVLDEEGRDKSSPPQMFEIWLEQDLNLNDEISIRIVDRDSTTRPENPKLTS